VSEIVFVDTNVLLDVLLDRAPFVRDAQRLWTLVEQKQIRGAVSAASFLNVYYIVRRFANRRDAERAVRAIRALFQVVSVDQAIVDQAIESGAADFEDAVQYACAVRTGAQCIVTRDERHFARFPMPALPPSALFVKMRLE